MDASTLTCCGNRLKTTEERVLDWLAVIGGFAGLVHTIFFSISQVTAHMGAKKSKSNAPQAYAREVVVEM